MPPQQTEYTTTTVEDFYQKKKINQFTISRKIFLFLIVLLIIISFSVFFYLTQRKSLSREESEEIPLKPNVVVDEKKQQLGIEKLSDYDADISKTVENIFRNSIHKAKLANLVKDQLKDAVFPAYIEALKSNTLQNLKRLQRHVDRRVGVLQILIDHK